MAEKTRARPEFGFKLIKGDTLPENPKPKRDATNAYSAVLVGMEKAKAKPNRWAEIAHYNAKAGSEKNPGGARKVCARLLSGDVKLPDADDGWGFDIEWLNAWYDGSDREGTVLMVRYSPDDADAAGSTDDADEE